MCSLSIGTASISNSWSDVWVLAPQVIIHCPCSLHVNIKFHIHWFKGPISPKSNLVHLSHEALLPSFLPFPLHRSPTSKWRSYFEGIQRCSFQYAQSECRCELMYLLSVMIPDIRPMKEKSTSQMRATQHSFFKRTTYCTNLASCSHLVLHQNS